MDNVNGQPCPLPQLALGQWGVPEADGREENEARLLMGLF